MVRITFWCAAMAGCLVGCAQQASPEPAERRPAQAGQPIDPVETAARIAVIRGAALVGNDKLVQANVTAMQDDFRRAVKLADPARRVDHEAARAVVHQLPGILSVAWVDHENLLAIVDGTTSRSFRTIDAICLQLEPLGDTLGVVVHLQDGTGTTGEQLSILSRNCQLAPGDRALLQRDRQLDVISPHVRAQSLANQDIAVETPGRRRLREENRRILEAGKPEM